MFEQQFLDHGWLTASVWVALFFSDYYLTLAGARLYAGGAQAHFAFEGSYELNPAFQAEVDQLRRPGFRALMAIVAYGGLLLIASANAPRMLYAAFAGALLLPQAAIHFRHLRNLVLFRFAAKSRGVSGQIKYERWLSERISALEFVLFGVWFALTWLLTGSALFLGGAISCAVHAGIGFNRSLRARASVAPHSTA